MKRGKESGDTMIDIVLPVTSSIMTGLARSVMVWEVNPWRVAQTSMS